MNADFRSDTVTKPTPAMRRAMAEAEVGDDVFGDDPTVIRLEERIAELFGREAALFTPSGTMANQISIGLSTRPGDEVLMEEKSHTFHFEVAGTARLWGCQPRLYTTNRGIPDPAQVAALVRPDNVHIAKTALCLIENTHNFHGGRVVPIEVMRALRDALPDSVRLHLDGARIWNAHVATGTPLSDYAAVADTVQTCLSKGLGCPAGSLVIADRDAIAEGRRLRKMLGGGMRQVGVLAAPALLALDEGFGHLAADHARAKRIAEAYGVDPATVDSNIVIVEVPDGPAAEDALAEHGVRCVAVSPTEIRFCAHRDIDEAGVEAALGAASALR